MMRVLSIDEGSFSKKQQTQALLVGCLVEDGRLLKVIVTTVTIDGGDATDSVIRIARKCTRLDLILMGSISVAGFNVVDPHFVNKVIGKPLLVVNRQRPRLSQIQTALRKHFKDWYDRLKIFKSMRYPRQFKLPRGEELYYYAVGIHPKSACEVLLRLTGPGHIPEALRIARILARSLTGWPFPQTKRRVRSKRRNQGIARHSMN